MTTPVWEMLQNMREKNITGYSGCRLFVYKFVFVKTFFLAKHVVEQVFPHE